MRGSRRLLLVIVLGAVAVAGCQIGGAPEPTPTTQPTPTATPASLSLRQTPIATWQPTPPPPTATPTPSGPPPTPTATPEPTVSPQLLRQATGVQERAERLHEALRDGDAETLLRLQREMSPEVAQLLQLAQQDPSKQGKQIAAALDELRAGLSGNLPKLDNGRKQLAQALGVAAADPASAPAENAPRSIENLARYAGDLADRAIAFETALQEGRTADLLRLQNELLTEAARGQSLQNSRTRQAEIVRGALEDLRSALGGDRTKLAGAIAKLQQAAGRTAPTGPGSPAATQPVDLQPLANELNNKLGALAQALNDPSNKEGLAKAQQELADQARKAEAAIRNDRSPRADRLRHAIGVVREVANGDGNKVEAARAALQEVMAGG
ncbi:MAG: hypothetical protein HY331_04050 [Chloroflexi bacterium]|nr:hypothetical protein [Chloroflexota bacterium]